MRECVCLHCLYLGIFKLSWVKFFCTINGIEMTSFPICNACRCLSAKLNMCVCVFAYLSMRKLLRCLPIESWAYSYLGALPSSLSLSYGNGISCRQCCQFRYFLVHLNIISKILMYLAFLAILRSEMLAELFAGNWTSHSWSIHRNLISIDNNNEILRINAKIHILYDFQLDRISKSCTRNICRLRLNYISDAYLQQFAYALGLCALSLPHSQSLFFFLFPTPSLALSNYVMRCCPSLREWNWNCICFLRPVKEVVGRKQCRRGGGGSLSAVYSYTTAKIIIKTGKKRKRQTMLPQSLFFLSPHLPAWCV